MMCDTTHRLSPGAAAAGREHPLSRLGRAPAAAGAVGHSECAVISAAPEHTSDTRAGGGHTTGVRQARPAQAAASTGNASRAAAISPSNERGDCWGPKRLMTSP